MRSVEKVGKTVNDAITEALIELGASTEEVDIEIISKGSKGFIGFGAKDAKVRVTLKAPVEVEPQVEEIPEVKEDVKVTSLNKVTEEVVQVSLNSKQRKEGRWKEEEKGKEKEEPQEGLWGPRADNSDAMYGPAPQVSQPFSHQRSVGAISRSLETLVEDKAVGGLAGVSWAWCPSQLWLEVLAPASFLL